MDIDLMESNALVNEYKERFQRADERIAEALARLAGQGASPGRTSTGTFGFGRPSEQTLVWD